MTRPPSRPTNPALRSSFAQTREPAHLPLHRRLLFPTLPVEKPLPVLVPGGGAEIALLNERIYHLIALAFRAYILSWLPRITRDRSLLPHIHQHLLLPILLPIFASLSSDPDRLIPWVLYDLPGILTLHWKTYWKARETRHVLYGAVGGGEAQGRLDGLYHSILPLLSTEPYTTSAMKAGGTATNPPDRNTVPEPSVKKEPDGAAMEDSKGQEEQDTTGNPREIPEGQYVVSGLWLTALSDTIIKQSLPKDEYNVQVERTMMRELLGRTILGNVAKRLGEDWFWWSLLLKFLPSSPSIGASTSGGKGKESKGVIDAIFRVLEAVLTGVMRFWAGCVWIMAMYTAAAPADKGSQDGRNGEGGGYEQTTRCWMELFREIVNVDGRGGRRNWALRLIWGFMEIGFFLSSPALDRILPHLIRIYLLTPSTALRLVDILEKILFPLDGYPAPAPPDPTVEEAMVMRRELEERLGILIPKNVRSVLAPDHLDLQALLDPLSDAGCNAHLVGMIYASTLATVIPGLIVGSNV